MIKIQKTPRVAPAVRVRMMERRGELLRESQPFAADRVLDDLKTMQRLAEDHGFRWELDGPHFDPVPSI